MQAVYLEEGVVLHFLSPVQHERSARLGWQESM